ncbi:hypothetical protein [Actinokineospora sp.]|uniref:hypothetical protein n=1 Tax=Actinokineospora sp. TaxID=1872133 RepID=UPI0040377D6A
MLPDRRGRFLQDAMQDAASAYRRGQAAAGGSTDRVVRAQMGVIDTFRDSVAREVRQGPSGTWRGRWRQLRYLRRCVVSMHRAAASIEILNRLTR